MEVDLVTRSLEDVVAAFRHLEDLDVFVGQRSRLNPGPGWDITLRLIRQDLKLLETELAIRNISAR